LQELKLHIPPEFADIFCSVLTLPAVDFLFRQQLLTPDKVQEIVQAEDEHFTQEQQNCLPQSVHCTSGPRGTGNVSSLHDRQLCHAQQD